MKRLTTFALVVCFALLSSTLTANEKTYELEIAAVDVPRKNVPVSVHLEVPADLSDVTLVKLASDLDVGEWGQLTEASFLGDGPYPTKGHAIRELHMVIPELPAGKAVSVTATLDADAKGPKNTLSWNDEAGNHNTLTYDGDPIIRYMYEAYDDSTAENRERTYKVYHHVFHPDGKTLLTKGPGGKYTHHRGIYYGFSRCSYGDGKKADIWHCKGGVHQAHAKFIHNEAGPLVARQTIEVDWNGNDKKTFAKETRELTTYVTKGGLIIDFASKLRSVDGKLKVDGDPQHAGFQFRASNSVFEKTAGQTYYIRPDGAAKPGQFKQGEHQEWNGMSFVLGSDRFTVGYLDSPDNPKPAHYSERNYGRFGSYFVAEAEGPKTIDVNYRLTIKRGESDVEELATQAKDFTNPPKVTVKK